jgi:hypothetical protein
MVTNIRKYLFSLYERRRLRNWAYTVAFAIFVPVGCRFALLAWAYGHRFDRVMAVVAGVAVGCTAMIMLLRIWSVPPKQTIIATPLVQTTPLDASTRVDPAELIAVVRARSIRNLQIARGAQALGAPRDLSR